MLVDHVCQDFLSCVQWHLSGNVWTDPSPPQVLTFLVERGGVVVKVGCSQLLSRLSGNQLSPRKHTPILNFPIKSNPWHTLATRYHEPWVRQIRADANNTSKVFREILARCRPSSPSSPPSLPLLLLLCLPAYCRTPRGQLVPSQQHLQMTGCETRWKRTAPWSSFSLTIW